MALTTDDLKAIRQALKPDFDNVKSRLNKLEELPEKVGKIEHSVYQIEKNVDQIQENVYRLEVLYEDLDGRFKADSELLRNNLDVKDEVDDHERRLKDVEGMQLILRSAVKEHSQQLKRRSV